MRDNNYRGLVRMNGGYMNGAENDAAMIFKELGIEYSRRGYPDFTLIKDGKIVGFVEVKPNEYKSLRKGQELFKNLCDEKGIPFIKWCPEDGVEAIRKLLMFPVVAIEGDNVAI